MRFKGIEIKNFRQYRSLKFGFPKKSDHDMHLIIADNGVGKTNILNAITWCLYNEEPHLGDESKSLPRLNLNAKNDAKREGKDIELISVRIYAEDDNDLITFERKMHVKVDTDFESQSELLVSINSTGDADFFEGEEAENIVEKYMPKKIRQYFYFDGEQLDSYFISDKSSKIKESIHAISQVDIVTRTKERLEKIIQQKQKEAGKRNPDIQSINNELDEINKSIDDINGNINELNKQIEISENIIQKNSEILSGQENLPELEKKFSELNVQKDQYEKDIEEVKKDLFNFIKESKIALSLYQSAKKTLDLIKEKESQNALPPDINKEILQKILEGNNRCFVCDQEISKHSKMYIKNLLDRIQVSSETSNILMMIRSELERVIKDAVNYSEKKTQLLSEFNKKESILKKCEKELQQIDDDIQKYSDRAAIILLHNERKEHYVLLEDNKEKKTIAIMQLKKFNDVKKECEDNLSKELQKEIECAYINKQIKFTQMAVGIITDIEIEMMTEVRLKMQDRTMDYFKELIWKKGIYDHIKLDDKYQLDLIHRDSYSCVGSCSAAERSLLALSFTLALHEVSGFNSILFIDTPVSRVTGQNRINFAEVLKEVSKTKQLIMAFTPDEYSENIRTIFSPIASTSVKLEMNANSEITDII